MRYYKMVFWVYDSKGAVVTHYDRKHQAVEHANRIGGTWRRGRY